MGLFGSFLGYNPIQRLLAPMLLHPLSAGQAALVTGRSFFPRLMTVPFSSPLSAAFTFALIAPAPAPVAEKAGRR